MRLHKYGFLTVIALALPLLFTSCDAFFDANLFKAAKLGQLDSSKLSTLNSEGLVAAAYSADGQPVDSFFTALKGDPASKATVKASLSATFTNPSASAADQQEAAVLYADIELKTTGGDIIVNNVVSVLTAGGSSANPSDLLAGLVAGVDLTKASIEGAVSALNGLYAKDGSGALERLSTSIGSSSGSQIDSSTAANMAQAGIIAAVIQGVDLTKVKVKKADGSDSGTNYASYEALVWDLVNPDLPTAEKPTIASGAFTMPNLTTGSLSNLITAAGLGTLVGDLGGKS